MSKSGDFGHSLRNRLIKVSNFLHNGRRQEGASFEGGAILFKSLNLGSSRRLSRD